MALIPGARLGPYDIVAPLGAGGMGEVYRATDTKLKRQVALKILPSSVTANRDQLARFQREAEVLASLNHPNIAGIYGLETAGEVTALVMELVEGEDLSERIARGPIPLEEALPIAKQIADALEAAHEQGIIHRDIKPANIKLRPDGTVKVLDFGLAKAAGQDLQTSGPHDLVNSPTFTAHATQAGMILGTAAYMAPEQAKGKAVDRRADIWAFGVVLYEMLTGRRAFEGESVSEIIASVLKTEPEWSAIRAETPASVRRLLRRCLEKDPRKRLSSMGDARLELDDIDTASPAPTPARLTTRVVAVAAVLALVLVGVPAGVFLDRAFVGRDPSISFETKTWADQWITNARFAPDGQTIVYSAAPTGTVPQLFALRPGTVMPQSLGDPATQLLAISSKGELAVLIHAEYLFHRVFRGTLARMTMDGGPKPWFENVTEADWSPDGTGVAVVRFENNAWKLEYPVGHTLYEKQAGYISDPRVSPDGSQVAFVDHRLWSDDGGAVKIVNTSGAVRTMGDYWEVEGLAWSVDGSSVYFSATELGIERLRPFVARAAGDPRPHQALVSAGALQVYDVAHDGRMLVVSEIVRMVVRALIPGQSGERDFPLLDFVSDGHITPDGRSLVFTDESQSAGANYALTIRDLSTDRVVRFGEGTAIGVSPDGKSALSALPSGDLMVYPLGVGDPQKLARAKIDRYVGTPAWLPDSQTIVFCGSEKGQSTDCYTQALSASAPTPLGITGVVNVLASTDGRMLLTQSVTGGYRATTISGGTVDVHGLTAGDRPIAWSRDNRGIFVQAGTAVLARIERIDPVTGTRTLVKELAPPSTTGVNEITVTQWTDDDRSYAYAYAYRRDLTQLLVATGVGK